MGKRGPKPPNFGLLNLWEFEFYKVFRQLRDGVPLPIKDRLSMGFTSVELRAFIEQLRRMSPEKYWLTTQRFTADFGEVINLNKPPSRMDLFWAEQERNREIQSLERALKPPSIEAQAKRRKIWNDLVRVNTYATLRKVCGRWVRLPDVRRAEKTAFPKHVLEHAAQFLYMKRNRRFPRSNYGDDARIEYLARGMAGIIRGLSPMTAIERLRNM